MSKDTFNPGFNDGSQGRGRKLKDELRQPVNKENLKFNEDEQSFEYDVKSDDPDYDHPDPYNSAVRNGADIDSSYDEANPLAVDEYIKDESLEMDVDKLGMHIDDDENLEIDPVDEILSRTPEDDRDDLDEEGYPKNDTPMK